jgi:preprotein translocase subunit SecB
MIIAPLNLQRYFLTEVQLTPNASVDLGKAIELNLEDFSVDTRVEQGAIPEVPWQIILRIQHNADPKKNYTYNFLVEIVGWFEVSSNVPEDKKAQLLEVNGSSMLYGVAREVVRSLTAQGPFMPINLPSVSFYKQKEQ